MLVTGKRAAIKLGSAGQRSGREDDALTATWRRIQPKAVVQNAASTLTSHTGYAMGPVGPEQCLTAHALDVKISALFFSAACARHDRGCTNGMGNRHWSRDPCPARDQEQDLLGRRDRIRRTTQYPGLRGRPRPDRRAAGAETRRGAQGGQARSRDRRATLAALGVRAQELLVPGSALVILVLLLLFSGGVLVSARVRAGVMIEDVLGVHAFPLC